MYSGRKKRKSDLGKTWVVTRIHNHRRFSTSTGVEFMTNHENKLHDQGLDEIGRNQKRGVTSHVMSISPSGFHWKYDCLRLFYYNVLFWYPCPVKPKNTMRR